MMMVGKKPDRNIASVIVEQMSKKPEGEDAEMVESPERDSSVGLQAAGEKMMNAFHAKDTQSLVGAIRDMFDMLRFENHEE
jgi:tRNA threonylcarbamoyladenosine modification (KEOPS) complex  Pcc1 subunit